MSAPHSVPRITKVTPPAWTPCYTVVASNTTVVVRLLWFVPEFPPNFPPFVFGVNKNWQMLVAARPEASCARRDRFRQQKKRKNNNAEFFRINSLALYAGEIVVP